MKTKFLALSLVLLLSCQNTSKISGKVYDIDKNPLAEAKVQIIGTDIYTFTDDKGYFEIDALDRGDELLIVKPGFEMIFYEFVGGDVRGWGFIWSWNEGFIFNNFQLIFEAFALSSILNLLVI